MYSSNLLSNRSRMRSLAVKCTKASVCSFIWPSFRTVRSMFAQKVAHPFKIESTRLSSYKARNKAAEDRAADSAPACAPCPCTHRCKSAPLSSFPPAVLLSEAEVLLWAPNDVSGKGPFRSPSLLRPGSNCGSVRFTSSTSGSQEGLRPGARKSRSMTSLLRCSVDPSLVLHPTSTRPSCGAWSESTARMWPSCPKSCVVRTFRDVGLWACSPTSRLPGWAALSEGATASQAGALLGEVSSLSGHRARICSVCEGSSPTAVGFRAWDMLRKASARQRSEPLLVRRACRSRPRMASWSCA
mmetsp:Transcript_72653/g.157647  ORF Transcript_72653/g.157647 Transcript_72653/m.157647 type:complete len:299 (+) Transcript_72653:381-1277(+)